MSRDSSAHMALNVVAQVGGATLQAGAKLGDSLLALKGSQGASYAVSDGPLSTSAPGVHSPSAFMQPGSLGLGRQPTLRDAGPAGAPQGVGSAFVRELLQPVNDTLASVWAAPQVNRGAGLWPDIHRAFLFVDKQLYMWNYCNSSDFLVYDSLEEAIVAVALVRVKPGVYKMGVRHAIVVSTTYRIVLLPLEMRGVTVDQRSREVGADFDSATVNLSPIEHTCPTDNVDMVSVVGTSSGRIFMGGSDGCLYELLYSREAGWFSGNCSKINRTSSFLSMLLPSFLSFSMPDAVSSVVVDEARQIVYTLSVRNVISVRSVQLCAGSFVHARVVFRAQAYSFASQQGDSLQFIGRYSSSATDVRL
jgi:hypothetical protein